MQILQNKRFYFLLSFIEGGSVMATELLGAKMLAPYFGSSLYVWATVLAITLGGLALGYFAGGILSYKNKKPLTLFNVLITAAVFTILMPYTSKVVLSMIGFHSLIPSVIVCASVILLPPVFMMGMVSPLIIRAITKDIEQSGKASGAIYAISTLGGIIATFLFGFYIIPTFGLTLPCIVTGITLGLIPLIIIINKKKITSGIGFVFIAAFALYSAYHQSNSAIKILYNSEGLLGQIQLAEYPSYTKDAKLRGHSRWLYVNRILQSFYDSLADESQQEEKHFKYISRISEFADSLPKNTKVLLLGLGGGSMANVLSKKGLTVDVCELDKRMAFVSKKYFYLNNDINITIDDARHYIKTCTKKYDLIIFDTFKGEEAPNHVFTMESLDETKKILSKNGTILVNSFGYIDGNLGKGVRSIYKTFMHANFNVEVHPTEESPDKRNLLFFASLDSIKAHFNFIPKEKIDLADAVVLEDEYPVLDFLNSEAAHRWRTLSINSFINDKRRNSMSVFD